METSDGRTSGLSGALGTLRHALADPLSAAGLKLELVERRLSAVPEGSPLLDRVRAVKGDLAEAGRLLDLLTRLASIAGEEPTETTLGDLCHAAGVPIEGNDDARSGLRLRREASGDAVRTVASFVTGLDPGRPLRMRAEAVPSWVSLTFEASAGPVAPDPGRLLQLPRGHQEAEGLFLARACLEADGGRLEITREEDRLVARLSWPRPVA